MIFGKKYILNTVFLKRYNIYYTSVDMEVIGYNKNHKIRIYTEEKAKVVAAAWGQNWLNSLPR